MEVAQSLLLLSLAAGSRCFAAGAYVFPSIDEDQRWSRPDEPEPVSACRMRRIYNTEPPPDYGVVSLGGTAPPR